MFNPDIYRSYDIRGIVPAELDAKELYHIGRAYARLTRAKHVVVARDMRPSGDELEPKLIQGLTDGGVNVINIGLATSPMFYFAVHFFQADGGLMVTASHNPGQYNGVKMTRQQAIPIAGDTGLMAIKELVKKRTWPSITSTGRVEERSIKTEYLAKVTAGFDARGLKIVADAGNGMTGSILKDVFKKIGGQVIPLYWELDGTFPHHEADPLKEENLSNLKELVKKEQADIGVAFDGDGDRVFFVDEKTATVPGDLTTALIAKQILAKYPAAPIIYDIRSSRATEEAIRQAGGQPVMWKVGHSLIKAKMREVGARFAGEVSGHFYFTPWYAESSILAMGYVLSTMNKENKKLSQLITPLNKYAKTPEINFSVTDKDKIIQKLRAKYQNAAQTFTFDGIRYEYRHWWFSVRPSNTEPKLRLNMEADTTELLQAKQREIEAIITAQ